jgi:hypothetical protein
VFGSLKEPSVKYHFPENVKGFKCSYAGYINPPPDNWISIVFPKGKITAGNLKTITYNNRPTHVFPSLEEKNSNDAAKGLFTEINTKSIK